MPDMFGRSTTLGGSMSSEATALTFTSDANETISKSGLILQQVNITYSQNVTRLYALEDANVYFVAGRTEGQMQVQHVVGPNSLQVGFITAYSDVCAVSQGRYFEISMFTGCGASAGQSVGAGSIPKGAKAKVKLLAPVITSLNLQMQVQNMIIGSGLGIMFVSLELEQQ